MALHHAGIADPILRKVFGGPQWRPCHAGEHCGVAFVAYILSLGAYLSVDDLGWCACTIAGSAGRFGVRGSRQEKEAGSDDWQEDGFHVRSVESVVAMVAGGVGSTGKLSTCGLHASSRKGGFSVQTRDICWHGPDAQLLSARGRG